MADERRRTRDWTETRNRRQPISDRRSRMARRLNFGIDVLTRYLRELRRAIEDGADIFGCFHWSIMAIFEWAEGYRQLLDEK